MNTKKCRSRLGVLASLLAMAIALPVQISSAATPAEVNSKVGFAIERLYKEVPGSDGVIKKASGVLVFPGVVKAGFIIAGEGGQGALMVGGKIVAHYDIMSASVGFQGGAEKKDIIMAFMDADSLKKFRDSNGWKAGADGSVTLINVGANAKVDLTKINEPIVGFVVGQSGLMAGVSLDGSKISRAKD
jgi:lipid-binding SYLF domain-containing protein